MTIKIDNLNCMIDQKRILKNISMDIDEGKIIGLIGHNGAGKTSLFKSILQLGYFKNKNIEYPKNFKIREDISFLTENRGLFNKSTAIQNLYYFAKLKLLEKDNYTEEIQKWLDFFLISQQEANQFIYNLSKGNQQKIQFIASILGAPRYVLLDEPFSGLDPVNSDLFIAAIKKLKKEGAGVVFSSHQMAYVSSISEEIFIMKKGVIVEKGDIGALLNRYVKVEKNVFLQNFEAFQLFNSGYYIDAENDVVICTKKDIESLYGERLGVSPTVTEVFKFINGKVIGDWTDENESC